jgi:putative PEP-CTERM system TPR-repeat lipoprotein
VLCALTACTKAPSFDELLDRASAALQSGDLDAAAIDIKAALQQQPANARARLLLGEVYFFQQKMPAAADEFERALSSEFTLNPARRFARALFRAGEYERLLDLHNEGFFRAVESDGVYLAVIARTLAMAGEIDLARTTLQEAAAASPDAPYVRFTMAEFLARADRDYPAARQALREVLDSQPDFAPAWSLLGVLSLVENDYADARRAFEQVLAVNPFRFSDRLNLASLLVSLPDWEAARPQIAALAAAAPTDPGVTYLRARLSIYDEKLEQALQELNAVLGSAPQHTQSLYLAALLNAREGNYATATNQLSNYLQLRPQQTAVRLLLGKVLLNDNRPDEAESIARSILESDPSDTEAMKLLGVALAQQTEYAASADVYARILSIDPEDAETHARLGDALTRAGQYADALVTLRDAQRRWPDDLRLRVRLVQAYLEANRLDEAAREAAATLQALPDNSIAHTLVGQTALANGDRLQAKQSFERAIALDESNRGAREALAGLAVVDNDLEAALGLFRDALASDPDDLRSLSRIADIQAVQQDVAGELLTLRRAIEASPEALEPQLRFARSAILNNNAAEAVAVLREARERHSDDPRVHQLLAEGFLALGELESARVASGRVVGLAPRDPEALRLATRVAIAQSDYKAAYDYLQTALEVTADPTLHASLAEVLLRDGKLDEASAELDLLPPELAATEPMQVLQGKIRLRGGDLQGARRSFEAAYEAAPTNRSVLALSAVLWQLDDRAAAIERLADWVTENPDDEIVLNQLASYQSRLGAEREAVSIWERLLRRDPENAITLNNLAWHYRDSDTRRALQYVDQALDIAPDSANVHDTRALILLNAGREEEALQSVDRALRLANGVPLFLVHRAQILAALGRREEAREVVEGLPLVGAVEYRVQLAELRESLAPDS